MATIGDLCTTIIGDLARGDTSLSDIVLIDIKSAIREYENQRFFFNEQTLTCTLSATDTYQLTLFATSSTTPVQNIIEVDKFDVIINSSRKYMLTEKTFAEFTQLSAMGTGVTGYPQIFTIWNEAIKIFPQANSNYVSELHGHVKFQEVGTDGYAISNPWSNVASELIRNATLKRLWGRRFRDYDAAKAAAEGERLALVALQRRTEAASGSSIAGFL